MISNNGKSNLTQLRGYVRGSKLNLNQLIVAGINPVPSNNLERCTCIYNATGLPCDDLFLVGMSVPRLRDYQPFPDRLLWMHNLADVTRLVTFVRYFVPVAVKLPANLQVEGQDSLAILHRLLISDTKRPANSYAFGVDCYDSVTESLKDCSAVELGHKIKHGITLEEHFLHLLIEMVYSDRFLYDFVLICKDSRVGNLVPIVYVDYVTNEQEGWYQFVIELIHKDAKGKSGRLKDILSENKNRFLTSWEVFI